MSGESALSVNRITADCVAASSDFHLFLLVKGPLMDNRDSLFLEILGIKAGAHGRFAIVAVLVTFTLAGAGYLVGRTYGFW